MREKENFTINNFESKSLQVREEREQIWTQLENIKKHLKVQVDVKTTTIDMTEVEKLCGQLDEKDRDLMLDLMKVTDEAQKEYLKNWVNREVFYL